MTGCFWPSPAARLVIDSRAGTDPKRSLVGSRFKAANLRFLSLLLVTFLAIACAHAETPWEQYLLEPTPENARLVSAIGYSDDTDAFYSDIHLLEVQVSAGDVEAFKLVLRLAEQSDGGDRRDLKVIASRVIRSHPELLLTQFESDPRNTELLTGILVTVGEEYIDRPLARKYELQARRAALIGANFDPENDGLTRMLEILDKEIAIVSRATASDR